MCTENQMRLSNPYRSRRLFGHHLMTTSMITNIKRNYENMFDICIKMAWYESLRFINFIVEIYI